ncbi:hypothetical protein M404DRAFT_22410 [Pisolithus tinctorius Marx 270]|uniref:Uncharacterized protein n=1 Tax=Pisolithus tinctorius Marx 270 TaxID=870435 RepID=A0A0C3P776_PISTI|nr:hypothetical protein M404DRAFT_22410 [Pisolithus tinctorius Marx 270]
MDIKFIGSGAAAKALTYYVSDYITKNELQVHVGLQAIRAAMDSHRKHFMGDVEASSTVCERNLLTKAVNAMMGRRKVSHQQVMSYLIGGGDYYTSHEFHTIQFYEFIDIVLLHELHIDGDCDCGAQAGADCPGNVCGSMCMAHASDDTLSVVLEPLDYTMHPTMAPFEEMCLWQFWEQMQKVKRTGSNTDMALEKHTVHENDATGSAAKHPAYSCRFRVPFADPMHLQFSTHKLCMCNTFVMPILLGESIPLPRKVDWHMEEFCRAMLLLFSFDAYHFGASASSIISNFLIELECRDARDVVWDEYNKKTPWGKDSSDFRVQKASGFDVELLKEALILDLDLDQTDQCESESQLSGDLDDQSGAVLPQDELDIIAMLRALHGNLKRHEHSNTFDG